jgi:nucleotide-binding universal stress UspA family protein
LRLRAAEEPPGSLVRPLLRHGGMKPIRHILVPIDFGQPAELAVDHALELARKFDAKITMMHAFLLPVYPYVEGAWWPTEGVRKEATKAFEEVVAKVGARWPRVASAFVDGVAWQEIVRVAGEQDVDLVVMGTHGRRGLAHAFLGSVAERVVRLSPVPVLTVGAGSAGAETEPSWAHQPRPQPKPLP